MTDYEARVARVLRRAAGPTMRELVQDGADLDSRVVLDGEPEPIDDEDVPEDTVPGE